MTLKNPHMKELRLRLDSRKRISLAKLLTDDNIFSFRAYREGGKIILEPLPEIHAHEHWLHKNPKALKTVQKGLKKKGKHYLGSFATHLEKNEL
jgi:hypothetical protein